RRWSFGLRETTHTGSLPLHDALPISFRGNEHDPAPIAREHAGQIRAREPHTRHNVDLVKSFPIRVRDFDERFRLKNSGIVHENIDRKSTRLNSIHGSTSYAVFCLK